MALLHFHVSESILDLLSTNYYILRHLTHFLIVFEGHMSRYGLLMKAINILVRDKFSTESSNGRNLLTNLHCC